VVKTDYAGGLNISWAAIQDLSSDKKLYVATPDKKLVSGPVSHRMPTLSSPRRKAVCVCRKRPLA